MSRAILLIITFGILTAGCAWMGGNQDREERITFQPDSTAVTRDENLPDPTEFIEVDELAKLVHEDAPIYPVAAKKANKSASVMVQVFVGPNGRAMKATAVKCDQPGYGFEIAAVAAAYKTLWRPAMLKGKPVGVWVAYSVGFAHH